MPSNSANSALQITSYITSDTSLPDAASDVVIVKELLIVNSVKKYLHCTDGKLIEAFYKNNQNLDNYHRNILARVIIYKEYEVLNFPNRFKITTDRFLSLNLEIAELFPNEKNVLSLYYTPYHTYQKTGMWKAMGQL